MSAQQGIYFGVGIFVAVLIAYLLILFLFLNKKKKVTVASDNNTQKRQLPGNPRLCSNDLFGGGSNVLGGSGTWNAPLTVITFVCFLGMIMVTTASAFVEWRGELGHKHRGIFAGIAAAIISVFLATYIDFFILQNGGKCGKSVHGEWGLIVPIIFMIGLGVLFVVSMVAHKKIESRAGHGALVGFTGIFLLLFLVYFFFLLITGNPNPRWWLSRHKQLSNYNRPSMRCVWDATACKVSPDVTGGSVKFEDCAKNQTAAGKAAFTKGKSVVNQCLTERVCGLIGKGKNYKFSCAFEPDCARHKDEASCLMCDSQNPDGSCASGPIRSCAWDDRLKKCYSRGQLFCNLNGGACEPTKCADIHLKSGGIIDQAYHSGDMAVDAIINPKYIVDGKQVPKPGAALSVEQFADKICTEMGCTWDSSSKTCGGITQPQCSDWSTIKKAQQDVEKDQSICPYKYYGPSHSFSGGLWQPAWTYAKPDFTPKIYNKNPLV